MNKLVSWKTFNNHSCVESNQLLILSRFETKLKFFSYCLVNSELSAISGVCRECYSQDALLIWN